MNSLATRYHDTYNEVWKMNSSINSMNDMDEYIYILMLKYRPLYNQYVTIVDNNAHEGFICM